MDWVKPSPSEPLTAAGSGLAEPEPHHGEHVEAGPAQQVPQVGDGGVGGDVGREAALPLHLGQLQRAAQLVQRVAARHGADEDAVRLQDPMDLLGEAAWGPTQTQNHRQNLWPYLAERPGKVVDPVEAVKGSRIRKSKTTNWRVKYHLNI